MLKTLCTVNNLILIRNLDLNYYQTPPEQADVSLENLLINLNKLLEKDSEFEILMKQNEILSVRRKFEDGITNILEDAKRRKSGFFANGLPWWGWCLLFFFGFDDFLRWIRTMWIIPILLLVGTYFILNQLNMTNVPKNIYYDVEEKFAKIKNHLSNKYFK